MTTTVFMVRHGAHDLLGKVLCGRTGEAPLNGSGRRQAEAAARRLKGCGLAYLYASPVQRTWQTAEAMGTVLSCPVLMEPDLAEVDFGAWSGRAFEDLAEDAEWSRWNSERDLARAPGGEAMSEAQRRVIDFLERVRTAHPGQAVAAISHGDVIKAALLHVLGLPLQAYGRIDVEPGSVSTIVAGDWGAKVQSINEVCA